MARLQLLFVWMLLGLGACAACASQDAERAPRAPTDQAQSAADRARACSDLLRALAAEQAALSSCENDPQCGKPVPTPDSCGCSHDAVVRNDADTTRYTQLFARLADYRDVPACAPHAGPCDCIETDGAGCAYGHCASRPLNRDTLCDRLVDRYEGRRKRDCNAADAAECAAALTLHYGTVTLVRAGTTLRGRFQCHRGVMRIEGALTADANIAADASIALLGDVFVPRADAEPQEQPAPVEHSGARSTFMNPAGDINCVYTGSGGIGIYMPADGGPELSCDRSGPDSYVRVILGARGPARIGRRVGDASCCSIKPALPEGARLVRGPFACEQSRDELTCARDDGYGFALGSKTVRALRRALPARLELDGGGRVVHERPAP